MLLVGGYGFGQDTLKIKETTTVKRPQPKVCGTPDEIIINDYQIDIKEIDTIIIKSHIGAYQFDEKGTTIGKKESLIITYSKTENSFIITDHTKETLEATFKPSSSKKNSVVITSVIGKKIQDSLINVLTESLTTSSNPKQFIRNLEREKFETYVNKKSIKSLAKAKEIDWHFKMKYTTKEENEQFFKSCQSLDSLELYLSTRFDTSGYVIITDYSNTIDITVITKQRKFIFEGKYPNPIYQPWYFFNDFSTFKVTPILNLNINMILNELLPNKFLNKNTISLESLFNDYISWFFSRNGMEY